MMAGHAKHERIFVTRQLDKPVYQLLQRLRVAHGDASQWEVIQAALVALGTLTREEREQFLTLVRLAPSDQPEEYPLK